jgi:uncharacterized protein YndB with AHSA1/START domain
MRWKHSWMKQGRSRTGEMSDTAVKSDEIELTMERNFAHPPEAVFRAWTESDALRQWMGPGEITAPESQIEACQGGSLTIPMVHPDGQIMTARGEILEFVPNQKLRLTWAWDQDDGSAGQLMEITLEFIPIETGTRLTLHQVNLLDEEARDHHKSGWTGCYEKLEAYLGE